MESKKRKAGSSGLELDFGDDVAPAIPSSNLNLDNTCDKESKDENKSESSSSATAGFGSSTTAGFGGFAAYAKINPFAQVVANSKGFGFGSNKDTTTAAPTSSSSSRPNFVMPPPIVVPSPKSPKMNPFSSPSPVHNPFMTIVESKDELWKTMAKDKLTEEDIARSSIVLGNSRPAKRPRLFGTDLEPAESVNSSGTKNNETIATTENNEEESNEEDNNSNNGDETREAEPVFTRTYALPENVTVVTGEEDFSCLYTSRVKLYRLTLPEHNDDTSNDKKVKKDAEWIEVGVGPLKILEKVDSSGDKSKKVARLVMRREDKKGGIGTKLLINARLDQSMSIAKQTEKTIRVICVNYVEDAVKSKGSSSTENGDHSSSKVALNTYLIRTKESEDCDDIVDIIAPYLKVSDSDKQ